MRQFWQRLSKRERTLAIATLLILLLVLTRIAVISPYLQRREWVQAQLEIQPQLLEKNLKYVGQKD
jgi:type II secretory pathway component PulM